jgi:hypothetical protein
MTPLSLGWNILLEECMHGSQTSRRGNPTISNSTAPSFGEVTSLASTIFKNGFKIASRIVKLVDNR